MPEEKNSETTAKQKRAVKRPAAKRRPSRKRAAAASAEPITAPAAKPAAVSATRAPGERLTEVARTIGSTAGHIVAKTKRVLRREPGAK